MRWFFLVLYSLLCMIVDAKIINIPADYPTVQEGINVALAADTVLVQPGTYAGGINFHTRQVTVASLYATTQDEQYIASTILDGNNSTLHVVEFSAYETNKSRLIGFTITGGNANGKELNDQRGGGVFASSAAPVISHCRITGNSAVDCGGGVSAGLGNIHLEHCEINNNTSGQGGGGLHLVAMEGTAIVDCDIHDNRAQNAGGVLLLGKMHVVMDTRIHHNTAGETGGGMLCIGQSLLTRCLLYGNTSQLGGAVAVDARGLFHNPVTMLNCTFSGNVATEAGGALHCMRGAVAELINSILYADQPQEVAFADTVGASSLLVTWCDVQGGRNNILTNGDSEIIWQKGNIDVDPLFGEPFDGSLQAGSPCIDAGTVEWLGSDHAVFISPEYYSGNSPDIGAVEYRP